MPRGQRDDTTRLKLKKEYRSFQRGLITEASGLTYPENSCRDLDNVDIEVNGSIRRRLGISQERDGQLIGGGVLSDTLFTNTGGGPLSQAPSVLAASESYSYDAVTGNGDWTYGGLNPGIVTGAFELPAQTGNPSWMQQDLNITDFDRVYVQWEYQEDSSHEPKGAALFGADGSGGGQGFVWGDDGLRLLTSATHTTGYVKTLLEGGNYEAPHRFTFEMVKTSPGSFLGTLQVRRISDNVLRYSGSNIVIGASGDFITFRGQDGQGHRGFPRFDNIEIELETFGVETDLPDTTVPQNEFAVSTHLWSTPNGDGRKNFQVFQVGNTLFFRDLEQEAVSNPLDTAVPVLFQTLSFDGVGTGFIYNTTAALAARVKLQSASGNGRIWFTSQAVVPFYAELSSDGTAIQLKAVGVSESADGIEAVTGARLIRDLAGVDDGLDPEETPGSMSQEHLYNLLNQGWPSAKINDYFTDQANYPSNNQQWFFGKTDLDVFDPAKLVEQDFGSSLAPKGRLIMDALLGQRDGITHAVSGVDSPLNFNDAQGETSSTGWEAVAFFAGRVWFAGDVNPKRPGCVYFSKTLQAVTDAGKFFQQADPSSEHFNDLLATDGGYIPIPGAGNMRRLVEFGSGLLVMADNGVWFVYGRDGGFTANNFSVEKLTNTGIIGPGSVVLTDQGVLFWADNSVHAVSFGQESNNLPSVTDLGEQTIFKYYQLIPRASRLAAASCYDTISKKVFWFWLSSEEDAELSQSVYDRALIFDTRTGAFTTYSFPIGTESLLGVAGGFGRQTPTVPSIYEPVYISTGEIVTDNALEVVTAADPLADLTQSTLTNSIKLLVVVGDEAGLRVGEFYNLNFTDFANFSGIDEEEKDAYLVTGDDTIGDLQVNKQTPYVHSFFTRTESGFYPDQTPKRASGCTLYARWDWHNSAAGNRWSVPQNAYRYRRPYAPVDPLTDTFDNGEEIVYTKLKVRGKGRAIALRYNSVAGKDFRLLGFSIPYSANED